MKLKDLEAYRAVLTTGSTKAAAGVLGVTQSAVSRRITQLEADLDLKLFVRDKSRLVPTRASRFLEQHVQDVLQRMFIVADPDAYLRLGKAAMVTLRVAVPSSMARVIMPRIVAAFLKEHPELRFEILHGPYDEIQRMLQGRQAEIGFLRLPVSEAGQVHAGVLTTTSVCVLPKGHRLLALETIHAQDLRNEDMILLGWRRAPRRDLDVAFSVAGVRPKVRIETHSVTSACGFVAQGIGVSIVNALLVQECLDLPIEVRPFKPDILHQFAFAHIATPDLSEIGVLFLDFATRHLRALLNDPAGLRGQ